MLRIYRLLFICITIDAFGVAACTTEDPRRGIDPSDAARPRGLGEQCNDMAACAAELTCMNGACTPDAFAAACTPNPCGEGFCNARGETEAQAFCRCDGIPVSTASAAAGITGFLWDGTTCVADTFPAWPGSVTPDTTCPAVELAPGVPDDTTANCPVNTFCTEQEKGGDCLELFVELDGNIGGAPFGGSIIGGSLLNEAECVREYIDGDEDGRSLGMRLVITGTLAASLFPGASNITVDVSSFDAVRGGPAIVLRRPQSSNAPEPRSDSGYVDVAVTSTQGDFIVGALGGEFIVDSVSGPDINENNRIDSGKGAIGGEFYLGFGNGNYASGAFTVNCGANVLVPAPPGS